MERLALALLPFAFAACATVPVASASPTVGIGQVASVDGLYIRPLAVLEDSRCPATVQCVWAGQVRIRTIVTPPCPGGRSSPNAPATAVAREIDLTLGLPVTAFGRTISLSAVAPVKSAPGTTDPGAYRFTFATVR